MRRLRADLNQGMLAVILLSSSLLPKSVKVKIYRTIILPVVLCGCETWSITLREECRLRVFENMVLRSIFGPKRDKVTGKWWRLHNEELYAVYVSPNIEWLNQEYWDGQRIATRYGLDGSGIESRWRRDFPHPSRPALGPTQLCIKRVPCLFLG